MAFQKYGDADRIGTVEIKTSAENSEISEISVKAEQTDKTVDQSAEKPEAQNSK